MPSDGNSANRTISLKHDFLAASGHEGLNAEGALRVSSAPSGDEFSKLGADHEQLSKALVNAVAPDQGASIILSNSQEIAREAQIAITTKRKHQDQQRLQLTLLEHARRLSKQLEQQISVMEHGFEANMGDAWREQIANKVMDPDDIPERRDGESMDGYRKRLEDVLVATMIDPVTGQVKPEYTDDPETRHYGEWAKAKHQKREVDAYLDQRSDPALSQNEREAIDHEFTSSAAISQLLEAQTYSKEENGLGTAVDGQRSEVESNPNAESNIFGP